MSAANENAASPAGAQAEGAEEKNWNKARNLADHIERATGALLKGRYTLEIGCGKGYLAAELARRGAIVTGTDVHSGSIAATKQVLEGHPDSRALLLDARAHDFGAALARPQGFDLIVLNGQIETMFELTHLVQNVFEQLARGGVVFMRIRNGFALSNVLQDVRGKMTGLALVGPAEWADVTDVAPRYYYRHWEALEAIFRFTGFNSIEFASQAVDRDIPSLAAAVQSGIVRIRRELKAENFKTLAAFKKIRLASVDYCERAKADLQTCAFEELSRRYRIPEWDVVLRHTQA